MAHGRLKAIRIGADAARGPYVEAEVKFDEVFESKPASQGFLRLYVYTIEGSIPEDRYMRFLDKVSEHARSLGCETRGMNPPGVTVYCSSKAVLQVSGSTLADEMGIPPDPEPGEPEDILDELGLGPIEPHETYIHVEVAVTAPLSELGWVKDNIAWILSSMDLLDARYQAKIVVDRLPRRPGPIESMESGGAKVMYVGGRTVIYLPGAHHLRDPKLYDTLRKAFLRRWF